MWLKCFRVVENWNHSERVRETVLSHDRNLTPMYILNKDHKPVKVGSLPTKRPVVDNNMWIGVCLAGLDSNVVEPTANFTEETFKSIST